MARLRSSLLHLLLFLLTLLTSDALRAQNYTPGDVYWAPSAISPTINGGQLRLIRISGPGDLSGAPAAAVVPDRTQGQMAFKADRSLGYFPSFFLNRVLTVTPGGAVDDVTPFALVNRPTGLLVVRTGPFAGHLLASSFGQDRVMDITAGGDFTNLATTAFARSTPSAQSLAQLPDGTILVATSNGIRNITAGGNTVSTSYASGFAGKDLVVAADGSVFATTSTGDVLKITGSGNNYSGATPFASGKAFVGLAIDATGRLLATVASSATTSEVYDITAGNPPGQNFASASPYAYGLPGQSDTFLDMVPGDPVSATTLPATLITSSGATLNATVNPGGLAASVVFDYGTTPALGSVSSATQVSAGYADTPISIVVGSLSSSTPYYFRVRVTTAQSTTTGSTLSFTTMAPPKAPTVTTVSADNITRTQAALHGTAGANGADTAVTVEYDTDITDGVYAASVSVGSTSSATPVNFDQVISGLNPGTLYHFRFVGTNSVGMTAGADQTFTTAPNHPPTAPDYAATVSGGEVSPAPLEAASDIDGDVLTLLSVGSASHGTATVGAGGAVTYDAAPGYFGEDSFTYTVRDPFGATATGTITVSIVQQDPMLSVLYKKGGAVPNAGDEFSGIPAGAIWDSLGVPCATKAGDLAFVAGVRAGKVKSKGIMLLHALGGDLTRVVSVGDPVPGLAGATFSAFKDPLAVGDGDGGIDLVFLATIKGAGVTSADNKVVCRLAKDSSGLEVIGRNGLAGFDLNPQGLKAAAFNSLGLGPDGETWAVATLAAGGGVTTADNKAVLLWARGSSTPTIVLRKGGPVTAGDGQAHTLTTIATLAAASGSPGHGRWMAPESLISRLSFADKLSGIFRAGSDGSLTEVARKSGSIIFIERDGPEVERMGQWASFGLPDIASDGAVTLFAKLTPGVGDVTKEQPGGIFQSGAGNVWTAIVHLGETLPADSGATFSAFKDPVSNGDGSVAFLATEKRGKVSTRALWMSVFDSPDGGTPQRVLARIAAVKETAPETGGAAFASFQSVALPDGESAGPLLKAKLAGAGVTSKNNAGLWAVDSTGALRLLLRTGSPLLGAADGSPTVKAFTVLGAVSGSSGQPRAYDAHQRVFARVTFSDGSTAVVQAVAP